MTVCAPVVDAGERGLGRVLALDTDVLDRGLTAGPRAILKVCDALYDSGENVSSITTIITWSTNIEGASDSRKIWSKKTVDTRWNYWRRKLRNGWSKRVVLSVSIRRCLSPECRDGVAGNVWTSGSAMGTPSQRDREAVEGTSPMDRASLQ